MYASLLNLEAEKVTLVFFIISLFFLIHLHKVGHTAYLYRDASEIVN